MTPPKLARFLLRLMVGRKDRAYLGDVEEIFRARIGHSNPVRAGRWYWREVLCSMPTIVRESIRWRLIMFKNYLVTAIRIFRRDKGYSFLNTMGLALGTACFTLIALWVRDEVNWDRFHEHSRSIFRVQSTDRMDGIDLPGPLGPYLKADVPEVVDAVRMYLYYTPTVRYRDNAIEENQFVFADRSLFDTFTIPFAAGNPTAAFDQPDAAVLTESAARKYFGDEDPLGKVLNVDRRFDVRVTGVVKDLPANSDIRFNILLEYANLGRIRSDSETQWGRINYATYIRLAPSADARAVEAKIAGAVQRNLPNSRLVLTMRPLVRIHLDEDGAGRYVTIYALVALFILALAGCNFVNLATAKAGRRAREIAVRKVVGAVRSELIRQHLFEAVFLAVLSLFIALLLAAISLPAFQALTGKTFRLESLLDPGLLGFLLGTSVLLGLMAGAYPALLLSSFRPSGLLKGGDQGRGRFWSGGFLRKSLIVIQFAVSIILMVSTLLVQRQIEFIRNYDLGLRKDNIVVLPAKRPLKASHDAFIDAVTRCPGVVNASFASSLPSNATQVTSSFGWEGKNPDDQSTWTFISIDERFLDTLGISLVQGRGFAEFKPVDESREFIINEKAVEDMGLPNPVGKRFSLGSGTGTVVGVIKNFHFMPLKENVRPLLLFIAPGEFCHVLVKIRPGNEGPAPVLAGLKEVWDRFAPEMPFSYEFLDASYDLSYASERKMNSEFKVFTFLGMIISCLGLAGLAAYIAARKRKEIGIRKILGAGLPNILGQIYKEFLAAILVSNIIAWPVAFWAMKSWLRDFAFHTNVAPGIFLLSAGTALAVSLATVTGQAVKAGRENPVSSLRYE